MHLIFSYLRLLGLVGFSDNKSIIYIDVVAVLC